MPRYSIHLAKLLAMAAFVSQWPAGRILTAEEAATFSPHAVIQTNGMFKLAGSANSSASFHAIQSTSWPNGLVPVFAYDVRGVYRLSRKPKTGWENVMEPVFFALPPAAETNSCQITGAWSVSATHTDGHTDEFSWELTTHGHRIAGRFDPHTDYRFASIPGGIWHSNRLELKVDYINEHFELHGNLMNGTVSGTWRRIDDGDGGTWQATRLRPAPTLSTGGFQLVPLFEWTSANSKERRYSTDPVEAGGFRRNPIPLCRVWKRGN